MSNPMRSICGALAAVVLLALGACDSATESDPPEQAPEAQLAFLTPRAGAPALAATSVSLLATKGEGAEVRIDYVTGEEFLRFKVEDETLLRRPDGTAIAVGEQVLITITVADANRGIIVFQPAGLRFDPAHPAELKIRYAEADDDLDDDGDVDDEDDQLESELAIWKQELVTDPWERVGSAVFKDLDEVEADLTGFTRYAIAYRR